MKKNLINQKYHNCKGSINKSVKDAALAHLSLHWDGKRLKNSDGETYEAEVILVFGAPDYVEGKILG